MRKLHCFALFALTQALSSGFAQTGGVPQKISIEPRVPLALPPEPGAGAAAHLRIDASLVLIPANVSASSGARVVDLKKENFQVFEDDVEQKISYFAKEDAPLSVGLLFDSSGSMKNKTKQAAAAAAAFFRTSNPEDEFFLIEFSEKPKLVIPFTADASEIQKKISHLRPFGRTALLDAIQMGLTQMKKARNPRRALVILSDGADNRSRSTVPQIRNAVLESDVQVYAMGIFDDMPIVAKGLPDLMNGPRLLDRLAADSGGRHFRVDRVNDLPAMGARIGEELRTQYLLGYAPESLERDGKYHRVKVQLAGTEPKSALRVHYRPGYHAPGR